MIIPINENENNVISVYDEHITIENISGSVVLLNEEVDTVIKILQRVQSERDIATLRADDKSKLLAWNNSVCTTSVCTTS